MMKNENKKTEKTFYSLYIDKDLDEKVYIYAKEHKWSKNFAISEILNQFLSCEQ